MSDRPYIDTLPINRQTMLDSRYRNRNYKINCTSKVGMGTMAYGKDNTRYLLTANHVIEGTRDIQVIGLGMANVYKTVPSKDIAVISVQGNFKCATMVSSMPKRGRKVACAGYIAGYTSWIYGYLGDKVQITLYNGSIIWSYEIFGDIIKGFSGSGVFDTVTGEYIGMILADSNDPGYEDIGYMIGVNDINTALK